MKQVYYGWYLVAIAMAVYAVILGTTFAGFGVYVLPVSSELKLTRAEMNTALILMNVGNAALAPFIGRLLDRLPTKWIMVTCGLLFALGCVGLSLSRSLALSSVILAVVMPVAYLGGCSLTMTVLIARWFTAQRGRAMTLAGIGMSLGSVIVTPILGLLVEDYGWRAALQITGVAIGAMLVTLGLVLRERPGPNDVETRASAAAPAAQTPAADQRAPLKVGALLRMPQFWMISLSTAMALGVYQTIAVTLIPLARESGYSALQATSLMSVMGAAAIVAGLSFSIVADKIDRVLFVSVLFLLGAALNAMLLSGHSYPLLVASAAILGASAGTVTPIFYALLADRFGTATFGTLRGLTLLLISVLGIVSVRFAGEVYDRTGGYQLMFVVFLLMAVAAAGMMFATRFTRAPLLTAAPATSSS